MASRIISLPWRLVAARATTPRAAAGVTRALSSSSSSATLSSASCRRTVAFHPPAPTRHNRRRSYSSSPSSSDKVKFWPFIAVIAVGTAGYIGLVNRRKEMPPPPPRTSGAAAAAQQQQQQPTSTTGDTTAAAAAAAAASPVFSPADTTVIFVLGGPGAGKGTQCANLVREYGFTHLSAGDLLRAEQDRPGSQFGDLIRDHIKNGLIVPMEVTIKLLENAMRESLDNNKKQQQQQQQSNNEKNSPVATTTTTTTSAGGGGRFLIDGFPRKLDQAHKFEESVCAARMVLFFDCPEAVMEERLLERGKTSGRADDNADSIRKRFRTFVDTSMPVVEYYAAQAKVVKIDATPAPDHVFAATRACLAEKLGKDF